MDVRRPTADYEGDTGSGRYAGRWLVMRWWAVLLGALLGVLAGAVLGTRQQPTYETRAVVVASETELEADSFGDLGATLFATDSVLEPVVTDLGLPYDWETLITTGTLEANVVSGAVALEVTATALDPETAESLATTAAGSFASRAEINGLGIFEVVGTSATEQDSAAFRLWWVLGAGGAFLALAVLVLLYTLRQPVVALQQAEEEFPAEIVVSIHVKPGRRPGGEWEISPPGAEEVFARRLTSALPFGATVWLLVADRAPMQKLQAAILARQLQAKLAAANLNTGLFRVHRDELLPVGDVSAPPIQAAVAIVTEGVPGAVLRILHDQTLGVADKGAVRVLIFLHRAGWRQRRRIAKERRQEGSDVRQGGSMRRSMLNRAGKESRPGGLPESGPEWSGGGFGSRKGAAMRRASHRDSRNELDVQPTHRDPERSSGRPD